MQEFPDDENGRVLRDMASSGDDLSKERDIDFSIIFSDQSSAENFCQIASKEGWATDLDEPDTEAGEWDVTVTTMMLPNHSAISAMEERLLDLASSFGGRLDGWGCFAV